jgi:hypothetical protein
MVLCITKSVNVLQEHLTKLQPITPFLQKKRKKKKKNVLWSCGLQVNTYLKQLARTRYRAVAAIQLGWPRDHRHPQTVGPAAGRWPAHFPKTEKILDLFTHNPVLLIKNFPVFTDSLLSYGCHGDFLSSLVSCPWLRESGGDLTASRV